MRVLVLVAVLLAVGLTATETGVSPWEIVVIELATAAILIAVGSGLPPRDSLPEKRKTGSPAEGEAERGGEGEGESLTYFLSYMRTIEAINHPGREVAETATADVTEPVEESSPAGTAVEETAAPPEPARPASGSHDPLARWRGGRRSSPAPPAVVSEPDEPAVAAVVLEPDEPALATVESKPGQPALAAGEARAWNLWELGALAEQSHAAADTEHGYLLFYLRDFADLEGNLPLNFDALVRENFGDLLSELA